MSNSSIFTILCFKTKSPFRRAFLILHPGNEYAKLYLKALMNSQESNTIEKLKDKKYLKILILEIILMAVICLAILLIAKFIF